MGSANKHKLLKKEPTNHQPEINGCSYSDTELPQEENLSAMDSQNGRFGIDGSEEDHILKNSNAITSEELARRRSRRLKQLGKFYLNHYWALMEEVRFKYRDYYWNYGRSAFKDEQELGMGENGRNGDDQGWFSVKSGENGSGFAMNGENQCGFPAKSFENRRGFPMNGENRCDFPEKSVHNHCGFALNGENQRGFPAKSVENRFGFALNGENRCGFPEKSVEDRRGFALNAEHQCGYPAVEDRCVFLARAIEDRCESSAQVCGDLSGFQAKICDNRCGFVAETREDRSVVSAKTGENRFGGMAKNFPAKTGENRGGFLARTGENRCAFPGCKSKPMALTSYCHSHILSDTRQKLYKACTYVIKSAQTGRTVCGKPVDRATVPSLCGLHFQKAQTHVTRALKKAGLNVSSSNKPAPKFHVIIAEYVHHIQAKRREALRVSHVENAEKGLSAPIVVKEENVD